MKKRIIDFKGSIILAPMAGVTDSPFREICIKNGANIVYSEMISVSGVVRKNKRTMEMLEFTNKERPLAIQLFGSGPNEFLNAAKFIEKKYKPDIIDINLGCPVPKVAISSNAGSALMKEPKKVYEIVRILTKNLSTPVTVKIRSGWDNKHINAIEIAKLCEKAKASAIIIHPRTRIQGYSGNADWNLIKTLKENIKIPVIGNGDIKSYDDIKKMFKTTKCDGVAIGRAAIGNPWIFRNNEKEITNEERYNTMKLHLSKNIKKYGEKMGILHFRTHLSHYLKGMKNCKTAISELNQADDWKIILKKLKDFLISKK